MHNLGLKTINLQLTERVFPLIIVLGDEGVVVIEQFHGEEKLSRIRYFVSKNTEQFPVKTMGRLNYGIPDSM